MAIIKKYTKKNGEECWLLKAYLGIDDMTGKQVKVTKRGFTSKQEARKYLAKAQYDFDRGTMETASSITYRAVYNRWLPLYRETVKESSYQSLLTDFCLHILPTFGEKSLGKITPLDCQAFATELQGQLIRYKEVYNRAKRVYAYAIKIGLVHGENPFDRVILPKPKPSTHVPTWLSVEELRALLQAFEEEGDQKWSTFFRLVAYTGMRRGEALALRWRDINLRNGTASIKHTISVGVDNKEYLSDTPKTPAGIRTIDLDPETVEALRQWRKQPHQVLSLDDFVFPGKRGGWTCLTKPNAKLKAVLKKYGLKDISLHSFRHTHCAMLFEAGWTLKEVQERLGHDDASTTLNIYNHVTSTQKKKSLKKFIAYIKNT